MRQSHQHEKNRFGESFLYSTYLPKDRQSDKSDWREKSRGEEEAHQANDANSNEDTSEEDRASLLAIYLGL